MAQAELRTEGDVAGATGPYDAEVPVNSQSEADRNGALARALGVVLGKISGDKGVMSPPGVTQALRHATNLVDTFDYRQEQGPSTRVAP
ncbi:DUF2066 domain-containing protein, partial [Xanthomonas sp. LMG 12459]|uniref:DUF2066 domain-containing protein n=1 Tax=Xanthomonas sp. LMG 12459 TaxID=1591131 RepID=UPI0012638E4B